MIKHPLVFSCLWRLSVAALLLLSLSSCVTRVHPSGTVNAAPTEAFSSFQHFEVLPITMSAPYAGDSTCERALLKIQQNFDLRVGTLAASWNAKAPAGPAGRTLQIVPHVQDIKFVSGGKRFLVGAFAGSSAVVLKIKFVDKATGAEVNAVEFYQRAAAMGGAWTMGGTDNGMLVRITEIAAQYIAANYGKSVGGATGLPVDK